MGLPLTRETIRIGMLVKCVNPISWLKQDGIYRIHSYNENLCSVRPCEKSEDFFLSRFVIYNNNMKGPDMVTVLNINNARVGMKVRCLTNINGVCEANEIVTITRINKPYVQINNWYLMFNPERFAIIYNNLKQGGSFVLFSGRKWI